MLLISYLPLLEIFCDVCVRMCVIFMYLTENYHQRFTDLPSHFKDSTSCCKEHIKKCIVLTIKGKEVAQIALALFGNLKVAQYIMLLIYGVYLGMNCVL